VNGSRTPIRRERDIASRLHERIARVSELRQEYRAKVLASREFAGPGNDNEAQEYWQEQRAGITVHRQQVGKRASKGEARS